VTKARRAGKGRGDEIWRRAAYRIMAVRNTACPAGDTALCGNVDPLAHFVEPVFIQHCGAPVRPGAEKDKQSK